jgi:tryptophan-rich sensory protein
MDWWVFVIIYVAVCLISNLILWGRNMTHADESSFRKNPLIPPGWMIGLIWTIIFGFFGYTQYLLIKENKGKFSTASVAVIIVAVFCLLYPVFIYILSRGDWRKYEKYARLMNLLSLIVAFIYGIIVISESESAFWFTLPLLVWASYVNFADSVYMNFRTV